MFDTHKICKLVENAMEDMSKRGLIGSNIESMYKLVDIYKDLKNIKYWETKEEYYESMMDDGGHSQRTMSRNAYNDGNNYNDNSYARRKRDAMGRYSRAYDGEYESYNDYAMAKESYRNNRSAGCKERLMETLDDYMESFTEKMQDMLKQADCSEERETIKRYIDKLKNFS